MSYSETGLVLGTTLLCLCLIPAIEKLAPNLGLLDRPNTRKHHIGDVPLVGGIAIFTSIATVSLITGTAVVPPTLLILSFAMLLLGTVDDLITLSVRFRLLVQISIAGAMVSFGDIRIETIGSIFGGEVVQLNDSLAFVFTVMCVVGVVNAINMIDGLDGLAGSILLLSFAALGLIAFEHSAVSTFQLFAISGCLAAFLVYNNGVFRTKARIFLGDAGSMMLGLMLVWYFVELSQGSTSVLNTVCAGWIFGLPLLETISVMAGRLIDGRSPFDAGKDHLHHRLRRAGFSVNGTVAIMLLMHSALLLVGIYFSIRPGTDAVLFWSFLVVIALHFVIGRYLLENWGHRLIKAASKANAASDTKQAKFADE